MLILSAEPNPDHVLAEILKEKMAVASEALRLYLERYPDTPADTRIDDDLLLSTGLGYRYYVARKDVIEYQSVLSHLHHSIVFRNHPDSKLPGTRREQAAIADQIRAEHAKNACSICALISAEKVLT